MATEAELEAPECPVCLQPFDTITTIPRVLACGHSLCDQCLSSLPPPRPSLPDSLRCPSCTQLVPFLRSLGPSSLPKNIDLLRLVSPSPHPSLDRPTKPNSPLSASFLPIPWTQLDLLSSWKNWILPQKALSLASIHEESKLVSLGSPWFCRENQAVSLMPICAPPVSTNSAENEWFRLSYTAHVLEALGALDDEARDDLSFLLEVSSRLRRGICRIYGLWMGPEKEKCQLFLVSERFRQGLGMLREEREADEGLESGEMFRFGIVGKELCEAVLALHSEGIVCGCFGPSCFCFDDYGHCLLDLSKVLVACKKFQEHARFSASSRGEDDPNGSRTQVFVAPEVLVLLCNEDANKDCGFKDSVGYGSDVWSLACILIVFLIGEAQLVAELSEASSCLLQGESTELYNGWKKKVLTKLEVLLIGTQFESLLPIMELCLSYHAESRPQVSDIWRCFQGPLMKTCADDLAASDDFLSKKSSRCCLLFSKFYSSHKETSTVSLREDNNDMSSNISDKYIAGSSRRGNDSLQQVDGELTESLNSGSFKSVTLHGHRDCVTGFAVGGGHLFSSSLDKTINVWSLQDFSHLQSLRGHEHRVMAILATSYAGQPLCISGDSRSGIFIWSITSPPELDPLKKWYEHNDWRYSGVHSLAVSETGYLYSGSGDRSIKAWSLQDYSLLCTMTGHKSTVSSLAIGDGILYSGSWDGTVRLWWLSDHSPLSVLGDDTPEKLAPVLSLSTGTNLVISSYENGFLKIWRNDVLVKSEKVHDGSIYALQIDKQLLFTGGWDKIINIQELSENEAEVEVRSVASITCDSVVTSLLHWHGKLFVGLANKEIKQVYYRGS
ncbi:uncharacterized protein [Typha latifolia]|uniref:uncharacterized protein isoform X2 n=1 Tax=Typha latifolia TaxID=4733 RepID=UPI003C2C5386